MNNVLSDTISVSNLGNQLKQLVEKRLVSKENRRGGRYSLAKKRVIHEYIYSSFFEPSFYLSNRAGQVTIVIPT